MNTNNKKLKQFIPTASAKTSKMATKTTNTFTITMTSSTTLSIQEKWVINLSKKELTPEKVSTTERPKILSYPSIHPCQRIYIHYYCGSSLGRWTQWC